MKKLYKLLQIMVLLTLSKMTLATGSISSILNINPLGACRFQAYDTLFATTAIISPNKWTISDVRVSTGHLADENLIDTVAHQYGYSGHRAIFIRDYKGIIGTNRNAERVNVLLTIKSLENPDQVFEVRVKRIHRHFKRPYLVMEMIRAPDGLDLKYYQTRADQQKCDQETGLEDPKGKATPSVMTFNVVPKGKLQTRAPDEDVSRNYYEDACDCFDSYYDTIYGYTFIVPPHDWTITSYDLIEGRHVTTIKEPQSINHHKFFINGYQALVIHDKDQQSWDRSNVVLTLRSHDGKHEARIDLSRQEGWFSNSYIGKPEIIMNVESQSANVSDLEKVVTGPTWGIGSRINSTRGVSPAGVTFIIERDTGGLLQSEE